MSWPYRAGARASIFAAAMGADGQGWWVAPLPGAELLTSQGYHGQIPGTGRWKPETP
jgi:hypothetical protein